MVSGVIAVRVVTFHLAANSFDEWITRAGLFSNFTENSNLNGAENSNCNIMVPDAPPPYSQSL